MRCYSDLTKIGSYQDRFEYLNLQGCVGNITFGGCRQLNQTFYSSPEWKNIRRKVIVRDNGCDLAHPDYPIYGKIIVHHIEPITIDDILQRHPKVFDLENLICVSMDTHEAIHYGNQNIIFKAELIERKPGDTCPWMR